jgi:hypothetical protein
VIVVASILHPGRNARQASSPHHVARRYPPPDASGRSPRTIYHTTYHVKTFEPIQTRSDHCNGNR